MKKRKMLSLIIGCLILLTFISGCRSERTSTGSAAGDEYTFTYYWDYDWADISKQWGSDQISSIMRDMFNIIVRQDKPDIEPEQKMGIMITTGELPDVMMIERDAIYLRLIELDMLVPLDEYITGSKYAELLGDGTINMSRVNGRVYGLLNFATQTPTGNNGWVINRKIWQQLGSPPLNTTEDLYNYLVAVRRSGITVDGRSVIPLQFATGWQIVEQMLPSFGVNSLAANRFNGVIDMNGELKLYYNHPGAVEGFKFLNRLWNEGLINSDYFVERQEQVTEKLSTGRVAVYCGNDISSGVFINARNAFLENDPDNEYIVIHPPAGPGIRQNEIWNSYWYSLGWNVIVITRNAQNPERIFQLLDFVHSNEGTLLTFYGPEGVLWNQLDNDGFPILNRPKSSLSQDERDQIGIEWWTLLGNAPYMDLSKIADNNRKPEHEKDWVTNAQVNVLWQHSMYADAFLNTETNPQEPEGIAFSNFMNLNEQYIPRIIMAANENECVTQIQNAIRDIYRQNFELVEQYKTGIYRHNQSLLR